MSEELPAPPVGFSVFNVQTNRRIYKEFVSQHERDRAYIHELEKLLREHEILIPAEIVPKIEPKASPVRSDGLMPDGSLSALEKSVDRIKDFSTQYDINVQFKDLTFWNNVPESRIPTVGSSFKSLFFGSGPKRRVDIFKNLTGRILPKTMTLVMGPPGCGKIPRLLYTSSESLLLILCDVPFLSFIGKTSFLKALSGQLNIGSAHLDGEILYNGDSVDCGKYLLSKIASYVDEKELHAGTLTVRETLEFAWYMTTKGHHSYGVAKDAAAAEILDREDKAMVKVCSAILGSLLIFGCLRCPAVVCS
jgi:hypothetical protein